MWNYWGFNSGTVKYKNDYISTWTSLLRNEIDNGRPIYYGGTDITVSPNKAHVWVVDGYRTSDNTYHCNWGWGGDENGWFTLTDLTPDIWNFNSSQYAIMNIYPKLDACSGLSGASVICYPDTVQYSVTIPSTASVSWGKTGNLSVVGSSTNPTFLVRSTSNSGASGTITATIKNSQNQTFLTRTKTVWVGMPNPIEVYDDPAYFQCGQMNIVNVDYGDYSYYDMGVNQVNWSYQGATLANINDGFTKAYITAGSSPGTGYIYVDVYNNCGSSGDRVYYEIDCFRIMLVITPNPSNGEVTISIEEDGEVTGLKSASVETTLDENTEWELEIYDNAQNLKEKKTNLKGNSAKLQTAGWKEGVYIVRVKYKDEILTGKLVVKK